MYDILKLPVFWKIWQGGGGLTSFLEGGVSDGLEPALPPPFIKFNLFAQRYCTCY